MALHASVAAGPGITVTDVTCPNILGLDGPRSPGPLADALGLTRGGAVTALIDRLERAGYVRRDRDPRDRRRVLVALEPAAIESIAPLFADRGVAIGGFLDSYDDEPALFTRLAAGLGDLVDEHIAALRAADTRTFP